MEFLYAFLLTETLFDLKKNLYRFVKIIFIMASRKDQNVNTYNVQQIHISEGNQSKLARTKSVDEKKVNKNVRDVPKRRSRYGSDPSINTITSSEVKAQKPKLENKLSSSLHRKQLHFLRRIG